MPPDQTAAHSDDRRRHCRTRAVSARVQWRLRPRSAYIPVAQDKPFAAHARESITAQDARPRRLIADPRLEGCHALPRR